MTTPYTNSILQGIQARLYGCVLGGYSYDLAAIKRNIAAARIHYKAWEESYKLDAGPRVQYAYKDLPEDTKKMDVQVRWYFKLLDAFVKVSEET